MKNISRQKFVNYLSEGIPTLIPEDEVVLFYESLSSFINNAPNGYDAFYEKGDNFLVVSEGWDSHLKILYDNNLIQFRHPGLSKSVRTLSEKNVRKMGEAFVGVLIFLESINPTIDSTLIEEKHYDQWYH